MSGIRVDVEWLTRYSGEVRAAGEDIVAARAELDAARLGPEAFGAVGRQAGAAEAYEHVAATLRDQVQRAGDLLLDAGDELREVVDFHTAGDEGTAEDLSREQEA